MLIEHGNTVEPLAQAPAEVRQQLGEAQRLAPDAQRAGVPTTMTSAGQVDPRVMSKCPTFSCRDTEWSEWSFIFESVAAMANLERCVLWVGRETVCRAHS